MTKQITFTPYFVLINNAPFTVECQELERPADPWITIKPESCTSLWPLSERDDKLMKVRIVEKSQDIAAPFFITEMHNTLLKLSNQYGGINVDVQITEGAVYITFTPYKPGLAPALIINHTERIISFWEKESVTIRRLNAKNTQLFTWENPAGPRLLVWETGKKTETEDDLRKDSMGEILIDEERFFWVSFLDGIQRVLLFTSDTNVAQEAQSSDLERFDKDVTVSIHGLGLSLINNKLKLDVMYVGIASTGIIWEVAKMSSKRFKQLSVAQSMLIENAHQQFVATELNDLQNVVVLDQKLEVSIYMLFIIKKIHVKNIESKIFFIRFIKVISKVLIST